MRVLPKRRTLTKGDYVLATKFSDGDPLDNWAVGFFSHMTDHSKPRYMVIDNTGVQLRPNGFRRFDDLSRKEIKALEILRSKYPYKYIDSNGNITYDAS